MKTPAYQPVQFLKFSDGTVEKINNGVITEKNVQLSVNGTAWLDLLCTPLNLEALALGFLLNEGVIQSRSEVSVLHICEDETLIDVWLTHPTEKPQVWRRTSGCSGGLTRSEVIVNPMILSQNYCITPEKVFDLIKQMIAGQQLYQQVHGVHGSALADGVKILAVAEDVGRHNTLDKLTGMLSTQNLYPENRILLTTGRISSEMLQKSVRMGASMIISLTSPTSLSIESAEENGITLIGYAKRNHFNIYTHPERIDLDIPSKEEPSH